MKNTKNKGFSLAELMIALLVISVALAAAAPSITKTIFNREAIWKTSSEDNATNVNQDIIFFSGPNALIGTQRLPNFRSIKRYFPDALSTSNFDFSPKSDKLVIMGNLADGEGLATSHISFYNQSGTSDPTYAGRLASDRYNLAFGIGSLQSLEPDYSASIGAYNTAIGHYALFANKKGSYNTAFGYKALQGASYDEKERGSGYSPTGNIALGDHALQHASGNNNIAIGSMAGAHLQGSNNLVVGVGAGFGLTGSNNLLINSVVGLVAFQQKQQSVKELLVGHRKPSDMEYKYPVITDDDNFSIGILDSILWNDSNLQASYSPPVIQGFTRTRYCSSTEAGCADGILHAKGIIINTDKFNIRQNPTVDQITTAKKQVKQNDKIINVAGIPEGRRIFSVHDVPGNKDARTSLGEIIDVSEAPEIGEDIPEASVVLKPIEPCNGAIFCLSKFYVTTGTYFSATEKDDIFEWNKYNRTSVFPDFISKTKLGNTSLAHDGGSDDHYVYDLFIGTDASVTLAEANNRVLKSNKQGNFDNNLYTPYRNYIDVGKEADSDGLAQSRWTAVKSTKPRPPVLNTRRSLNIRTVKTAVNFFEEFKETSTGADRLRDSIKTNMDCLLANRDNPFSTCTNPQNITGVCTTWDRIKNKDCSLICPYKNGTQDCSHKSQTLANFKQRVHDLCKELGGNTVTNGKDCTGKPTSCETGLKYESSSTTSDARLKNISGDNTAGIEQINKLEVVNYTYKADKAKTPHVGVIAQDLKKVFPDAVDKGSDGYYRIRLEDMFYAMVNSVQQLSDRKDELNTLTVDFIDTPLSELQKQNADIKAQNELLKQKNAEMEKRLSALESK